MRTPGLATIITLAFAIAACSDASAPVAMGPDAMGSDVPSVQGLAHFSRGDKQDQCDDNDNDHRWGKRRHHSHFRHWGWRRHVRRHWFFRGHDGSNQDCDGDGGVTTGSISGTVTNEGTLAAGYSVFLLSADGSMVVTSTTTDATGAYSFAEVEAGTYLVCEDNPYTDAHGNLGETRPQTGGACPQPQPRPYPYASIGFSLTVAAGAALIDNNFSNARLD